MIFLFFTRVKKYKMTNVLYKRIAYHGAGGRVEGGGAGLGDDDKLVHDKRKLDEKRYSECRLLTSNIRSDV